MRTATVHANGIDIVYDAFGDEGDRPLVLVMGLGAQRLAWADEICDDLAAAGRYVIRFDNRDVGESTHLTALGPPTVIDVLRGRPPYRLEDMAEDLIGLLDALSIDAADVVGVSLGGFIAQIAAIRNSGRVRTLTLLMTSTGSRHVGRPSPHVVVRLLGRRRVNSKAEAVEKAVAVSKIIGSPAYPFDEDRVRHFASASYDRAYDPDGVRRQMAAGLCQRDRTDELRQLHIPTLVIHGVADPLVSITGGLAVADAIPGAKFLGFAGMGHNVPQPLWSPMSNELIAHTGGRA